jgi:cytochrome c
MPGMSRDSSLELCTRVVIACLEIALVAGSPSKALAADSVPAVASRGACMSCHAVDSKLVGPAFRAVAQKYKDDQAGQAGIEESMRKGSVGKWGPVPMPPNPSLKDDDVKILSTWILSL